jgi:1-acyl-sn-glycerol-3-phosphate acyltransferase
LEVIVIEQSVYQLGRNTIDLYTRVMLDMDVWQHAPLPGGPKIIAANHPTTTDPFFLLTLPGEQMSLLITEMAFKAPVFGHILRMSGHIPVLQDNGRAAFDRALELLKAGRTIGIFPEGSLSPHEGGLCKSRTGTARLALLSGAPVIPVGIHLHRERIRYVDTTFEDMSATARWYLNGPYAMTVGEPMTFSGDVEDRAYVRSVSETIMLRIGRLARESAFRLEKPAILAAASVADTGAFARTGTA